MANNNLDDIFKDIFYAHGCTDNTVTDVQLEGEDENGIIYYACGYKDQTGEIEVDSETIETEFKTRGEK